MEVKDGQITPTTQREAQIYSRLLCEQTAACEQPINHATIVQTGQSLSGSDSYKLFCAIERSINTRHDRSNTVGQAETAILDETIEGLARAALENFGLDEMRQAATQLFLDDSGDERQARIIRFASQALDNRYES